MTYDEKLKNGLCAYIRCENASAVGYDTCDQCEDEIAAFFRANPGNNEMWNAARWGSLPA